MTTPAHFSTLFFLLLLSSGNLLAGAQPSPGRTSDPYRYLKSVTIIIVILIAGLFLLGLFYNCFRDCSEAQSTRFRARIAASTSRSRRGLDAEVIGTFPTLECSAVKGLKIGKGALECTVCLNGFEDDETLRLIPKCDHVFHPECIDVWLSSHTTCPVCRANLVPLPDDDPIPQLMTAGPNSDQPQQQPNDDVEDQTQNDAAESVADRHENCQELTDQQHQQQPPELSTGHSLVQPGEDTEWFTLRLPVELRKQIMNRQLNRSTSLLVLPREGSSRRWPRTDGSNRARSYRRLEPLDRGVFSKTLSRMSSLSSPRATANDGEKPAEPEMSKSASVRPPV